MADLTLFGSTVTLGPCRPWFNFSRIFFHLMKYNHYALKVIEEMVFIC